jgi:outer membrane receptor protein involved in Fe transport
VSQPGFRTARVPVVVTAGEVASVALDLVAESGTLVVIADESGATLEVDGVVRGAIPASFELPVGTHQLRVTARGFQPIEQSVTIRANQRERLDLRLLTADLIQAASRVEEPAEEAPASISVIGARELRSMRYPTVAEALRGTRGLYVTDDRGYVSVGVRGLSLPGSYGKRVLVTLDGMPTNDNWLWASFTGFDLRTDLEDIERIEVVRGPGSVVYGTSAFNGVINLVTRGREVPSGSEAGVSAAADGVFRARARVTRHFGGERGFWTSIAGGASEGRDFFFPEYVLLSPPEVAGHARGLDRAWFATLTGRAWWKELTLAWSLNHHLKHLPAAQFEAIFGDDRARQSDTRGFLEARFQHELAPGWSSLTRAHANLYTYRAHFPYPFSAGWGGLDRTVFNGAWFGGEQRIVFQPSLAWSASLGSEVQGFPLAHTRESDEVRGQYKNDRQQLLLAAVYANVDVRPLPRLKLSAGARLDYYSSSGSSLNPRLALIAQPYEGGNLKLLFGKAFIAPSVSELTYSYEGQESNPDLRPENLYSAELEWSHYLSRFVVATASVYVNYVAELISRERLPREPADEEVFQYQNARTPIGTLGGELELRREWKDGWMLGAGYSLQRSAYLRSARLGDLLTLERSPDFRELPNAPTHLGSLRAAAPLLAPQLRVMSRLSYEGGRYDRYSASPNAPPPGLSAADIPQQTRTRGALLWDFVLTGREERWGLDYSLGIYNALDARAEHPVSSEFVQRSIPIAGRSLLAAANFSF